MTAINTLKDPGVTSHRSDQQGGVTIIEESPEMTLLHPDKWSKFAHSIYTSTRPGRFKVTIVHFFRYRLKLQYTFPRSIAEISTFTASGNQGPW